MISKKNLKEYEFNTMYDYYNYVIESKINGQFKQVRTLINNMSKTQHNHFIIYVCNTSTMDRLYLK